MHWTRTPKRKQCHSAEIHSPLDAMHTCRSSHVLVDNLVDSRSCVYRIQIELIGERFDVMSVRRWRERTFSS